MQIVVFFYLLDSLYAERRDRSVLFWRSMPVSDVRSVLAKLATALISVTAITFVATVALELVILVLLLIMGSVLGVHPWALLLHPGAFISSWLLLIYCLVVSAIWYLPYYGWNMLASSWAKKVPFLWSVLVPLGIMGAEGWVFHTFSFGRVFLRHAITWMRPAFNLELLNFRHLDDVQVNGSLVGLDNLGQLLASPDLWIGLVLAAGFVYGAIVLRRKRSEI
jgi:ABC-2 type transport system permease protein